MRVVITGATGNVGTALLRALSADPAVDEVLGLARRRGTLELPKVRFAEADIVEDDLAPRFAGADAVVHLAWLIQPARDRALTRRVNVEGSRRVFEAAAAAGVGALVHSSSVGAYGPGPSGPPVDESWPTSGVRSSFYSADKADAERVLDAVQAAHPALRVVRIRPGVVFQREAAEEIRRLFAGPLLPSPLVRPGLLPVLPLPQGLRLQAVHAADLADAFRRAILDPAARGAYNVAAEPVLDGASLARALGARTVPVPARIVRALTSASYAARLQPTPPGWLDLGLQTPVMDTTRAREELGWRAEHTALEALRELLDGLRDRAGSDQPPLSRAASGPLRLRELLTGVGARVGLR